MRLMEIQLRSYLSFELSLSNVVQKNHIQNELHLQLPFEFKYSVIFIFYCKRGSHIHGFPRAHEGTSEITLVCFYFLSCGIGKQQNARERSYVYFEELPKSFIFKQCIFQLSIMKTQFGLLSRETLQNYYKISSQSYVITLLIPNHL